MNNTDTEKQFDEIKTKIENIRLSLKHYNRKLDKQIETLKALNRRYEKDNSL